MYCVMWVAINLDDCNSPTHIRLHNLFKRFRTFFSYSHTACVLNEKNVISPMIIFYRRSSNSHSLTQRQLNDSELLLFANRQEIISFFFNFTSIAPQHFPWNLNKQMRRWTRALFLLPQLKCSQPKPINNEIFIISLHLSLTSSSIYCLAISPWLLSYNERSVNYY
jgi:hypothetical protein